MNWLYPPQACFGLRVIVTPDQPRVQLGTKPCITKYGDEVEWIRAAARAEVNAWARAFFGLMNILKDGDYVIADKAGFVSMNPRTYEQFRQAVAQRYADGVQTDGGTSHE